MQTFSIPSVKFISWTIDKPLSANFMRLFLPELLRIVRMDDSLLSPSNHFL